MNLEVFNVSLGNVKILSFVSRSNRLEVFCKKDVLKNFAKFTGKHHFIKKETLSQVFFGEFCKIFKDTFFIEHLPWLFLCMQLNLGLTFLHYLNHSFDLP